MEGAAELDKRLDAAVENYGSLLRSFAGALRSAGPEPSAEEQAALVARLDAAFAADRALQDVLASIGALDARAAQVREARTECAMAEADVHSAVAEALADVRAAVDRANAARRRVARLSALAQLCASIPSSCESPDAEGASLSEKSTRHVADTLAALAQRLALTAGPPRGWQPGDALRAHRPPCPTEDMMRCGALFRHTNLSMRASEPDAGEPANPQATDRRDAAPRPGRQSADMDAAPAEEPMFLDLDLNPHL